MPHFPHHPKPRRLPSRRGLTLAELMLASAVMAVMSLALATLVAGVRETSDYTQDQGSAVQHGRTAVARIERALRLAHASESFPGAMIVDEVVSSASLPHALAVWSPTSLPANPTGLPLVREILLYVPSNSAPHQLLEIRDAANSSPVPAISNLASWRTLVQSMRTNNSAVRTLITDHLRVVAVGGTSTSQRGMVRFTSLIQPSVSAFSSYRSGTTTWNNLAWPLGCYGTSAGVRVSAFQMELQISTNPADVQAETFPLFGSELVRNVLTR